MTKREEILTQIEDADLRNDVADGWSLDDALHEGFNFSSRAPSIRTRADDPAAALLLDPNIRTVPTVYREYCYICRDPEFAQMGLPLCVLCPLCGGGHIPADDIICDDCGYDLQHNDPPVPTIKEEE